LEELGANQVTEKLSEEPVATQKTEKFSEEPVATQKTEKLSEEPVATQKTEKLSEEPVATQVTENRTFNFALNDANFTQLVDNAFLKVSTGEILFQKFPHTLSTAQRLNFI